ncbi:rho GTPase-activating protein 30 isoform X2 [Sceloporus undulatus]|uniref:rho GTPase-activating protein 30 isoform X2 n=1 Tax=Sceloporus undulatus TaxID=8520 RepID=UPI001C4CDF4A|nr:rho GTPase-activating protein 30 isoform X2 [Sceloporus undulatus]
MSLAMKARQKVKRKGAAKDRVFGCDLVEHLQLSGQEVPQVLKSCTEFVECHGIVDGIYRLSGVSSNIQKLRLEFDTDRTPDLNKDVYLQDIHCVSSLCKAYFRELPNPLLTYQLYDKFADAVAIQMEEGRLEKIKEVLKELPAPHYRTLEFLMKHLVRMGSFSSQTNMHVRNLAIVWAPNLLRSKDIEASGFNGTAAFMEVRIQSIVVEFILTHVEQIFGDAPLRGGTRESLRKSLLLMGSPVPLPDDKCCFSYNVPAMLNQGDGPPQMRPYHTIIELTDSKKGSLKGKKWRSIFNLGRYSQDAKRRFLKPEDKDDKTGKLRLRPAKSMDSLSSVPCAGDDEALLGRKKSQKKLLTLGRESFDGPASLDSSFVLESEDYPGKMKMEEGQGKSEDEATAKSEPTTPKSSRSSLVGGPSPQGRSPKSGRSRAEKCVGVHISGPFSVTVPFHITSNLTLSRLTRGLECPALSHCTVEKEALEEMSSPKGEEESAKEGETEARLVFMATADQGEPAAKTSTEDSPDLEENRMSLEVQDSFSFLDNQDAWLGNSPEEEQQPQKNPSRVPNITEYGLDTCPLMEDDMGTGFMNEIIGGGMQLDMFSSLPPLNYLSIEECMNEHSEEEDDQYYLALGCIDSEASAKEVDSEEVYLSAFDDLSPLVNEAEPLQTSDKLHNPDASLPKSTREDQPTAVAGGTTPKDSTNPHLFEAGMKAQSGGPPSHGSGLADLHPYPKSVDPADEDLGVLPVHLPELDNPPEKELGISPNPSRHFSALEACLKEEAEAAKEEPGLLLEAEGTASGNGDNSQMTPNHPDQAPEENPPRPLDLKYENQVAPASLEDEWSWQLEPPNLLEVDHAQWPPCVPSMEMDSPIPEVIGISDDRMDCELLLQETELLWGREIHPQMVRGPLLLEDLTCLDGHPSFLLGTSSDKESSERSTMLASGLRAPSPEQPPSEVSLLSDSTEPDMSTLQACPPKNLPESLLPAPQVETPKASKDEPSDGSVHMKLTSSSVQVQQVKSFPVIPPKPQFAKIPPSLTPRIPAKDVPKLSIPSPTNDGNGMKERSKEGSSLPRSLRPASLDTYYSSNTRSNKVLLELSKTPNSLEAGYSDPGVLQTQRNSMPVSFEKYSRDLEIREGSNSHDLPSFSPPLEKYNLRPKSNEPGKDDLHLMKCSLPESLERYGKSELSPRQLPPEGLGSLMKQAPLTQRWSNWRNGGSMSFDEAVALAKERHGGQAPMRRMKTYCCGDAEGRHSLARAETPPPHCRPALKPLGQRPLRPQSCAAPATALEGHVWGKPLLSPVSPDVAPESPLSPSQEKALFGPQDFPPRSRLSLSKLGRRLSLSEEVSCMEPLERR